MLNTDATHLPNAIFSTPTWILEVDQTKQFTGLGSTAAPIRPAASHRRRRDHAAGHPRQSRHRRARTPTTCSYTGDGPRRARRHRGQRHHHLQRRRRHALRRRRQRPPRRRRRQRHACWAAPATTSSPTWAATTSSRAAPATTSSRAATAAVGNLILGGDGKDFIITSEDISDHLRRQGRRLHPRRQDQPAADRQRRRRLDRDRHAGRRARRQLRTRCWPTT